MENLLTTASKLAANTSYDSSTGPTINTSFLKSIDIFPTKSVMKSTSFDQLNINYNNKFNRLNKKSMSIQAKAIQDEGTKQLNAKIFELGPRGIPNKYQSLRHVNAWYIQTNPHIFCYNCLVNTHISASCPYLTCLYCKGIHASLTCPLKLTEVISLQQLCPWGPHAIHSNDANPDCYWIRTTYCEGCNLYGHFILNCAVYTGVVEIKYGVSKYTVDRDGLKDYYYGGYLKPSGRRFVFFNNSANPYHPEAYSKKNYKGNGKNGRKHYKKK
jgi:hypothetical protein